MTLNNPSHIEVDVAAGKAKHLVIADTFLPGWHATIDGKETTVIRCNHSQRLIVLPETECHVALTYQAPGLMLGIWMMLFATVSAFATWAVLARRKPRQHAVTQAQE